MATFIDLFGGIGGFRLGFEKYGHKCVGYYDIDKYATAVYNYNFGEQHEAIDITRVRSEDIPDHDILCGGFPCQSFSIAGKREGFEDITRGTLFFEILRILRDKRPKMVFLENVKGLLSHDKGRTFYTIINSLRELGYLGRYEVINSKNFGVPQNRERVFIIGHFGGGTGPEIFPLGQSRGNTSEKFTDTKKINYAVKSEKEIWRVYETDGVSPTLHGKTGGWQEPKISHSLHPNYGKGCNDLNKGRRTVIIETRTDELRTFNNNICGTLRSTNNCGDKALFDPFILDKNIDGRIYCYDYSPPLRTSASNYNMSLHGCGSIRRLTPVECERLQGFPNNWTSLGKFGDEVLPISDTQRYKMCGNAVTVNVIEAIAEKIGEL